MAALFVVQSFTECRWGIIPDNPIEVENEDQAVRLAERLAPIKPAVIAVYRWNNQAEVIAMFGCVPETVLEAANG